MERLASPAPPGRILPAILIGFTLSFLAFAVVYGSSRVTLIAPCVLLATVVLTGHERLLRWESLLGSVILVVFFIPIKRYTLPSQLPFNLEPYRLMIALVAIAWLTSLFIDNRVRVHRSGLEGPIGLFAVTAVVSDAINDGRITSTGVSQIVAKSLTFFASFFILLYVVVSLTRTRQQMHRLIKLLTASGSVVAFTTIIESRTHYNVFNHLHSVLPFLTFRDPSVLGLTASTLDRGGRLRVYGSAEHPIELSAVLVMLLPLALYLGRLTGNKRWYVGAVLLVLGTLATVSRTGLVMLVVVALVFLWLRPVDIARLAPIAVPLICVVYFSLPHTLGSFYSAFFPKGGLVAQQSAIVRGNEAGADGRLADVGPSLREWTQRPLLGEGFGSRVGSREAAVTGNIPRARLLDDQWLVSLLEVGVVGAGALLWLFTRAIRRMARISRSDDGDDGWLATAFAASLYAFAIGMLTFDALGFVQVTITFFILLALSSVLANLRREESSATASVNAF